MGAALRDRAGVLPQAAVARCCLCKAGDEARQEVGGSKGGGAAAATAVDVVAAATTDAAVGESVCKGRLLSRSLIARKPTGGEISGGTGHRIRRRISGTAPGQSCKTV